MLHEELVPSLGNGEQDLEKIRATSVLNRVLHDRARSLKHVRALLLALGECALYLGEAHKVSITERGEGELGRGLDGHVVTTTRHSVRQRDALGRRQEAVPTFDKYADGRKADVHRLAVHPGDVRRIGAAEPRGLHAVVQAESVQADEKGADVEIAVGTTGCGATLLLTHGVVQEDRRGNGTTCFAQHRLGELEHEMSQRLAWLIRVLAIAVTVTVICAVVAMNVVEAHLID